MKEKKKAEEEQMNKLEGKMYILIDQLQTDKTPTEVTLSGIDLGFGRAAILAKNIKINSSLLSLHAGNKNISDVDGVNFAQMLNTNKTLRQLDLKDN